LNLELEPRSSARSTESWRNFTFAFPYYITSEFVADSSCTQSVLARLLHLVQLQLYEAHHRHALEHDLDVLTQQRAMEHQAGIWAHFELRGYFASEPLPAAPLLWVRVAVVAATAAAAAAAAAWHWCTREAAVQHHTKLSLRRTPS
jgi:hypothetical protein